MLVSLGQLKAGAVQPARGTQGNRGCGRKLVCELLPPLVLSLLQRTSASFDFSKYLITSDEKLHFPCSFRGPEPSLLQLLCILFVLSHHISHLHRFFLYSFCTVAFLTGF